MCVRLRLLAAMVGAAVLAGTGCSNPLARQYEYAEQLYLDVDGSAELADEQVRITPSHAVLHRRPRPDSPPSATGCAGDCQPIG